MRWNTHITFAPVVIAALISVTFAQQPIITPSPSDSPWSVSPIGPPEDHRWQIELGAHATEGLTTFTIRRATGDDIIHIKVTTPVEVERWISLDIGLNLQRFKEVASLSWVKEELGGLHVNTLYAMQLGSLTANSVNQIRVNGDVLGPIYLRASETIGFADLDIVSLDGDCLGDITMNGLTLGGLPIGCRLRLLDFRSGFIGTQGDPITIECDGSIRQVFGGEINADIRGFENSGIARLAGEVRKIQTFTTGGTSGIFRGEVRTFQFRTAADGTWGMDLAGNFESGAVIVDTLNQVGDNTVFDLPVAGLKGRFIVLNPDSALERARASGRLPDLDRAPGHELHAGGRVPRYCSIAGRRIDRR